ncbi:hypothetical protein [Aestuariimicrobium sp. Y1814]|uniref:hypothetical protein n=1 Tax=Aestuariimicrobium sp. Y1814 TaxID=3418742 RepID=UPI003DA6FA29
MSDERPETGRRARRASDDPLDPDVIDDTAGEASAPARRGGRFADPEPDQEQVDEAGEQDVPEAPDEAAEDQPLTVDGEASDDIVPVDELTDDESTDDEPTDDEPPADQSPADESPADEASDEPAVVPAPPVVAPPVPGGPVAPLPTHAAFMRPGTATSATPSGEVPSPPEPVRPGGGRFSTGDDDGAAGPAPRRSATTSTTPPEAPSFEAPGAAAAAGAAATTEAPAAAGGAGTAGTQSTGGQPDKHEPTEDELTTSAARNPWPTRILVGVLVLALIVAATYFTVQQARRPDVSVTVTQSPSTNPSPSTPDAVTDASLLTDAEAAAALGGAGWATTETLTEVLPSSAQVTCMTNPEGLPNAQITRQRVLTSTESSALAALHRLDSYATAELAQQAYQVRLAKLSACDDVPALLNSAATVDGLADESFSVTIAYQDPTVQYRTVVLSRTGTAVSMLDVAQNDEAMDPSNVAAAALEPAKRLCTSASGTCPTELSVRPEVVPPTPIYGWLAQSDVPRITSGQGLWSATQVGQVTTKGSQCENITLASVNGPTEREQRSYLLSQDDRAPEAFGVDQVRFLFPDADAAKAFADKLGNDIAACADRTETAEVSEDRTLSITGQNRQVVTGRIFLVTQATGENTKVYFRVAVVVSGERVTYLVSNTRENFDFTTDSWLLLAARAGQRITQSR